MNPGLVSVTFRKLSPADIIDLCQRCHLRTLEWGGDVHVPVGNLERAVEVGDQTRAAGLTITAYGSYYRLAVSSETGPSFEDVLETAKALGAESIRVWAGNRPSVDADPAWRQKVVDDALRCADLAAAVGIPICYEFHDHTLTDTIDSACDLLAATVHPFIKTLWQPPSGVSPQECLAMLPRLVDRLRHLHVFYWEPDYNNRRPLASGAERWTSYLAELRRLDWSGDALLEFVDGDDPAKLPDDAATLLRLLSREN